MNLFEYLKTLPRQFSKDQVQESCQIVIKSINEHSLPAARAAVETFAAIKPKNAKVKTYLQIIEKNAGVRGKNAFGSIVAALENGSKLAELVNDRADALFGNTEAPLGQTFQKAFNLRMVSLIGFANEFTRKFLSYVYAVETEELSSDLNISRTLTKAEIGYVEAGILTYSRCLGVMLKDEKDVVKAIGEVPDILVDEGNENVLRQTKGVAVDPFNMSGIMDVGTWLGRIPTHWNPFYMIGMVYADITTQTYNLWKEEKAVLEMRRMNLKMIYEKTPDAGLQKQIEHMSNQINKLDVKIKNMERQYA